MPRLLTVFITATDLGFLAYWLTSAAYAIGWVDIPADWLFADYHDVRAIAWNWSFLPLDIAVSILGLTSVWTAQRRRPWRMLAALSLALCSTAGGMAIGYWTLLGEFELEWFLPNLFLLVWPLLLFPMLTRTPANDGARKVSTR